MAKKVVTATVEEELIEQVEKLVKFTKDLNVSKVINMALKELFAADSEYSKIVQNLDDSVLIPINQYCKIFGMDRKTVTVKISQGRLDTVTIGEKKYIKLSKDDPKNIFYQIVSLGERVEKLEQKIR